jgi:hypothetical protein
VNSMQQSTELGGQSEGTPLQVRPPGFVPGPLTQLEIEALRRDSRESALHSQAYFREHAAHLANEADG